MDQDQLARYADAYWRFRRPSLQDPNAPPRQELLWELVARMPVQPEVLLDIGCGHGSLAAAAASRGMSAIGMDISERAIGRAQLLHRHRECEFHVHRIEERPWPVRPGSVDLAISFEVIAHLLDPAALIRGAAEALRPGGYLALTTPYHGALKNAAIALLAFDRVYSYEQTHIRFFTDAALRRILDTNGFRIERLIHRGRCWGLWKNTFVWARKGETP